MALHFSQDGQPTGIPSRRLSTVHTCSPAFPSGASGKWNEAPVAIEGLAGLANC